MIGQLDSNHIDVVLTMQHVGRLGCCIDDKPYVVPITYVYQDGIVYGHTNVGKKVEILRRNPNVCLEVDQVESLEKWRSVIAWGIWEELEGVEAADALGILASGLKPFESSETAHLPDLSNDDIAANRMKLRATKGIVYRIKLGEKTGRYERH